MLEAWRLKSPTTSQFVQQLVQVDRQHQISAPLSLFEGNVPVIGEFPSLRAINLESQSTPWPYYVGTMALRSLISTNGWINNRDAGDLRRHRAHYSVTVMDSITGHLEELGPTTKKTKTVCHTRLAWRSDELVFAWLEIPAFPKFSPRRKYNSSVGFRYKSAEWNLHHQVRIFYIFYRCC